MAATRTEAGRERRGQILEAALGLFLKRGYEGTPMSAIAGAVGISKPGIVHHFPAKVDILKALYYPSFAKVEALLDRNPGEEDLLEGYLGIMLEDRALATLMATDLSVLARPEIGEKAVELMERLRGTLAGEGGEPRREDAGGVRSQRAALGGDRLPRDGRGYRAGGGTRGRAGGAPLRVMGPREDGGRAAAGIGAWGHGRPRHRRPWGGRSERRRPAGERA